MHAKIKIHDEERRSTNILAARSYTRAYLSELKRSLSLNVGLYLAKAIEQHRLNISKSLQLSRLGPIWRGRVVPS